MYVLLLVAMSTPTVTPTLDQTLPTTTVRSTPMVMPTLDQMPPTTTAMSTPTVMPTLYQMMPTTTAIPKQVVRKMLAVKTPKGVYASLCVCADTDVCTCWKNSNRNNITLLFCRDYPWA